MEQTIMQRQANLPESIRLLRHLPSRPSFDWKNWDPSTVQSADDLPPYLILGRLNLDSVDLQADGWSALWHASEPETYFKVRYMKSRNFFEVSQKWCGIDGGLSMVHNTPLSRVIMQWLYMKFPSGWDNYAKEELESRYQLVYIKQSEGGAGYCGLPDGALRTIAFPIAVKSLRAVQQWLKKIIDDIKPDYPVSVEAKLMFQAINYVEGKAPEWATCPPMAFNNSIAETGLVPYGLPVKETAQDETSAWTLRRDVYIVCITLPFTWVFDFLQKMTTVYGPVRTKSDSELRVQLRPIIIPSGLEYQAYNIALWDEGHTTRCFWSFSGLGRKKTVPSPERVVQLEETSGKDIEAAEVISTSVSREALEMTSQIMQKAEE